MTLNSWFDKGQTFETYRLNMKVNQTELNRVYEQLELTEEDLHFLQNVKSRKWRGIVLTADWCGDAAVQCTRLSKEWLK